MLLGEFPELREEQLKAGLFSEAGWGISGATLVKRNTTSEFSTQNFLQLDSESLFSHQGLVILDSD